MSRPSSKRNRRLFARQVALVVLSLGAFATSGCFLDNDVSDARCTPADPDITLNDDCPYQQSRGPQIDNPACATREDAAQSGANWQMVFGVFTDASKGNCSALACHGEINSAANGIFLPADNEQKFYEVLTSTTGSVGKPYVNADTPLESWIQCNVAGTSGGGLIMPKPAGMPSRSDAQTVEDWIHNGAIGPPQ